EAGVAPAGAETNRLAFEDRNVERGIGELQVVGRGESSIAGSDDGDVDSDIAAERGRDNAQMLAAVPVVVHARVRLGGHVIARGLWLLEGQLTAAPCGAPTSSTLNALRAIAGPGVREFKNSRETRPG